MFMSSSNGEKLSWFVIHDPQHLKSTKDGWVNREAPTGNVAQVIHPGFVTDGGSVKKGEDGNVKELCAVCRIETGRDEFGIFDKDGFCQNCGANRSGNGPRVVDMGKIIEKLEEDVVAKHDGDSFVNEAGIEVSICGADGLPRKVYLRDELLSEAGVSKGVHYSDIEYRAIKEDDWEELGGKPEGYDKDQKYKYVRLVGFNEEKSPLTLDEIQELIDCPNVLVRV